MGTKKLVGALLLIVVAAVYLTIREEGKEKAFGGLLAPIETVRVNEPGTSGLLTGNSIPDPAQSHYGQLVQDVRSRVNSAIDKSARRSSR